MKQLTCVVALGFLAAAPSFAQQSPGGAYRLASLQREIDGKAVPSPGKPSHGCLVITPRACVLFLTNGARVYCDSTADKAALWESLTAHAGTYGVEGRKLVLVPNSHSNESFVGRADPRNWEFKGNRLLVTTEPRPFSRDPSKTFISRQEWERIEKTGCAQAGRGSLADRAPCPTVGEADRSRRAILTRNTMARRTPRRWRSRIPEVTKVIEAQLSPVGS